MSHFKYEMLENIENYELENELEDSNKNSEDEERLIKLFNSKKSNNPKYSTEKIRVTEENLLKKNDLQKNLR